MIKHLLVVVFLIVFSNRLLAQHTLKGRVLEDKTRVALVGVNVQNLNNKQSAVTDNNGWFTIKGNINDILLFKGFAYENDTLLVTRLNNFEVFLLPQRHELNPVSVKTMDGPSMAVYDPYFHGQTVAYQTDKNGNPKGGVALRFWYWKKDERKRKQRDKILADDLVQGEIDRVFTVKNLTTYLPLKADELGAFISMYKPTVKKFKDNDFLLADYLNICYKKFVKLPVSERKMGVDAVFNKY